MVTQARFRQNSSIEGKEKSLDCEMCILAEAPQNGTSEAKRTPVSDYANEITLARIARPTGEKRIMLARCRIADHL